MLGERVKSLRQYIVQMDSIAQPAWSIALGSDAIRLRRSMNARGVRRDPSIPVKSRQ
jgi:hypothetical protein